MDFNASLQAPLLVNAVTEFLLSFLLGGTGERPLTALPEIATSRHVANIHTVEVQLGAGELTFTAILALAQHQTYPLTIRTGLRIEDGNLLILERFQCQISGSESAILPADLPDRWVFHLGTDVFLEELRIQPEQIDCRGWIMVQP
jgi:hypothetical protein